MSFDLPINQDILSGVSYLDHFRGAWKGKLAQVPADRVERLRHAVRVQSVASSCRLAGIRVADADVGSVLLVPETPIRDRAELLGYDAALSERPEKMLDASTLARLHAVMLGEGRPGAAATTALPWRDQPLCREAFTAEGTATGRVFQTLPPRLVQETIDDLLTWLELELRSGSSHPLLVIGTFMLALLAASPFAQGNGRLSRLLTVRLLRRAGYAHIDHASLERVIEETRESYYAAYDQADTRLWTQDANLEPWLSYFLETLTEHSRRAQSTLDLELRALQLSPLQNRILETIREHGSVDAALLLAATGANRNTLKDNMRRLVKLGLVDKSGERRGTRYSLGSGPAASAVPSARGDASSVIAPGAAGPAPSATGKPIER